MTDLEIFSDAAILGGVAGIRGTVPPAIISHLASEGTLPAESGPLTWLAHSGVATTTAVLAAGETIADKFPILPYRTEPGPLAVRGLSGAMAGAALASARKRPVLLSALIGAGTAIAATFAVTNFRRFAKEQTGLPDFIFGLAEDALVVAGALHVLAAERQAETAV